jgi:hypothetical protein
MTTTNLAKPRRSRTIIAATAWLLAIVALSGSQELRADPGNPFPSFPQQFTLQGPGSASFALAVTQPGPVVVDVQANGAPVVVTLRGLGGQPIQQRGAGHVGLNYLVTAADVQRSALWSVSVALIPAPSPAPQASGTITVQAPPVDMSRAMAHATAYAAHPPVHARDPNAERRQTDELHRRQSALDQDAAQRRSAQQASNQALFNQLRAGNSLHTRGLPQEAPANGAGVSTRNVAPGKYLPTQSPAQGRTVVVPGAPTMVQNPVQPPPLPVITQLYQAPNMVLTQARPLDQVILAGKNFGTSPATLVFTLGPNTVIPVEGIQTWSDTLIIANVPDATGLLPYGASVLVAVGTVQSNAYPFQFVPATEIRSIGWTSDMLLAKGGIAQYGNGMRNILHPNSSFMSLGGDAGNDIFFIGTNLENGWTVQSIDTPTEGTADPFGTGNAVVVDSRIQTIPGMLYFNVRWWFDAFAYANYSFTVWITGPRGVPDGVAVP